MTTTSPPPVARPADPPPAPEESRSPLWRVWLLIPILALAVCTVLVVNHGNSLIGMLGHNPPSVDEFVINRVDFGKDEVRIRVTNPQREDLTIAAALIDDAIIPFEVEGGSNKMDRLDQRTIVVPFQWVEDEPYVIGVTSSTGIQTTHEVPAAVERAGLTGEGLAAGAILGLLVGVLPVGLGMLWLPSLRRARNEFLVAFMAMTAGLLVFVGLDAFAEALDLQTKLPGAVGGLGVILLGISASYLIMAVMGQVLQQRGGVSTETVGDAGHMDETATVVHPLVLATMVAIGIGMHNLGEGLAIGSSFALGELSLGVFLVVGFMIHNLSEGLGIAVPASRSGAHVSILRMISLTLIAGAPAILGVWIGRYITNDLIGVLFFSLAVGAATHVVVEVVRSMRSLTPDGRLLNAWSAGGFIAGITVMYLTGVMVG